MGEFNIISGHNTYREAERFTKLKEGFVNLMLEEQAVLETLILSE